MGSKGVLWCVNQLGKGNEGKGNEGKGNEGLNDRLKRSMIFPCF